MSVGQELSANVLGLCCFWGECSQEEEATCQHLIVSMMLCMSNSYAVWLLSALFEIYKKNDWPVERSLLHHWDVVLIHHWDVVYTLVDIH